MDHHHHEPRCLSPLNDDFSLCRVPNTTDYGLVSDLPSYNEHSDTAEPGNPLSQEPDGAPHDPSLGLCGYEPETDTSDRNAIRKKILKSEASSKHRRGKKARALQAREKRRLEETLQQLTRETEQLLAEKTWLTQRTGHLEQEVERQTKTCH